MKADRNSKVVHFSKTRQGSFAKIKVPAGWDASEFSEVFEFVPTNSFSREEMTYEIKANSYFNIHYGDIHATFNEQILDFKKHINQIPVLIHAPKNIDEDSFLRDGDLIIADASEDYDGVGECIEIVNINGRKVLSGLHTIAARDKTRRTHKGFRAYLLNHPQVSINLKRIATGSKVYGISKTNIASLTLVIPPLPEQKKIALILSTFDRGIEKTEQIIAQKQKLKTGLMQQLLTGKVRFKEFVKSKRMKKTKIGMIPEDWLYSRLGDLVKVKDGTHITPKYLDHGIPFLRVTDLVKNQQNENKKYISKKEHEFLTKVNKPTKGDILYSKNGTIGVAKLIDWDWEFSIFVSLALLRIKDKAIVHDRFLELWLNSEFSKREIYRGVKQGTVINLHLEEIEKFRLALPTKKEQEKIALALGKAGKEITIAEERLKVLKSLKIGLKQQLLTGYVRVKT